MRTPAPAVSVSHKLILAVVALSAWSCLVFAPDPPPPFYTPPVPLPSGPPGTVIRSEPIREDLPSGAVGLRVLYLSTGLAGEPIAVSATVLAPLVHGAVPAPVIAWGHGSVGVLPECCLSYTDHPYAQTPAFEFMVGQGFVVVSTDYPGLGTPGVHPYLDGPSAARAMLDSVRAARALDVNAGDEVVAWGASQGGHAALFTGQLAATYAPELRLLGVAAAAPATDLTAIFRGKLDDVGVGVFLAELLFAWSSTYGLDLAQVVEPERLSQVEKIARTCLSTPAGFLTVGGLLSPNQYLRVDVLATEPWRTHFIDNSPRGRIDVPLLVTHGDADSIVPFSLSEAEVSRRCAEGEDVQLVRLAGVGHDGRNEAAALTIAWMKDRFSGLSTAPTCTQTN